MQINDGFDLKEALTAKKDAERLKRVLDEAFYLAGRLDHHGLEYPDVEDAQAANHAALDEINRALDVYSGKAAA